MKLNQIIAAEKKARQASAKKLTECYHLFQKPSLFNGLSKKYEALNEEEDTQVPPEHLKVQESAFECLHALEEDVTAAWDLAFSRDAANCLAQADVVVDGHIIIKQAPVTFLLAFEKYITELLNVLRVTPVLSPDQDWTLDQNINRYKTPEIRRIRNAKIPKVLKKFEPTEHQPGQADVVYIDQPIGHWVQVNLSGAVSTSERQQMIRRAEKLLTAIITTREECNSIAAQKQYVGKQIFNYVISGMEPDSNSK